MAERTSTPEADARYSTVDRRAAADLDRTEVDTDRVRPDDLGEGELSEREPTAAAPAMPTDDTTMPTDDSAVSTPDTAMRTRDTEDTMRPTDDQTERTGADEQAVDEQSVADEQAVADERAQARATELDRTEPTDLGADRAPAAEFDARPDPESDMDGAVVNGRAPDAMAGAAADTEVRDGAADTVVMDGTDADTDVMDGSAAETGAAPGDVEMAPVGALWPGDSADRLRERWQQVQLRFVDEPRAAADEADRLVEETVTTLTQALQRQRAELGQWRSTSAPDTGETEHLRVAVRRYREFLDAVLTL